MATFIFPFVPPTSLVGLCTYPGCTRYVSRDEHGTPSAYCSPMHRDVARAAMNSRQPFVTCAYPSCSYPVWRNANGAPSAYCSPVHRDAVHAASAKPPVKQGPIRFYDRAKPYFQFTNFSRHQVVYGGKMYPTAEHLFQAHKFLPHRPDLAEYIRAMPTPRMALQEASRLRPYVRPDWFDVNVGIMDVVLENKFRQHAHLTELLRGTGKRELVEDSPTDLFWGIGDGAGRNELGRALMRLRTRL